MPNLLTKLHLEELSLVDRPANAQAMVSLFKRDNPTEEVTKMNEAMEAKVKAYMSENKVDRDVAMKAMDMYKSADVEKTEAKVITLEAEVATLKTDNELLRKGLIDNGYTITADAIEKKAEVEMMDIEGEMVVKSDIPAPVLKALEAAAKKAADYAIEKADTELTKSAGEILAHFDIAVAKSLVLKFSEDEEVMKALKAADAVFEGAMKELGKSDVTGDFTSPADKLDSLVKSYMDDNKLAKSDYAKAYAAVAKTEDGKSLINKSYKGE